MTDHSQLVKHARFCANGFGSPKGPTGDYGLFDQLADAIDALQARVEELEAGLRKIRDKQAGCYRAADCQAVARALLERTPS